MSVRTARKSKADPSNLEREVIVAVIALYALICVMVLAVHHLFPGGILHAVLFDAPVAAAPATPHQPKG